MHCGIDTADAESEQTYEDPSGTAAIEAVTLTASRILGLWGERAFRHLSREVPLGADEDLHPVSFLYDAAMSMAGCALRGACGEGALSPRELALAFPRGPVSYLALAARRHAKRARIRQYARESSFPSVSLTTTDGGVLSLQETLVAETLWPWQTEPSPASSPYERLAAAEAEREFHHSLARLHDAIRSLPPRQRSAIDDLLGGDSGAAPHDRRAGNARRQARHAAIQKLRRTFGNDASDGSAQTPSAPQMPAAGEAASLFQQALVTWAQRSSGHDDGVVERAALPVEAVDGRFLHYAPPPPRTAPKREPCRVTDVQCFCDPPPTKQSLRALWEEGMAEYFQAEQYEEALASFQSILKKEPGYTPAKLMVAAAHQQLGRLNWARQALEEIISKKGSSQADADYIARAATHLSVIHLTLSRIHRSKQTVSLDTAIDYAMQALSHPTPMRVANAVLAFSKAERYIEAARVLKEALAADHSSARRSDILALLQRSQEPEYLQLWNYMSLHN